MFVRQLLYPLLILLQPVSTNLVSEQLSSQPATTRAIDYLPLKTGNVWRYNVISGSATNPTRQLVGTVMSAEAGSQKQITFTLRVEDYSVPKSDRPDEPTEFTLRANGDIFCDKCAGYLLKAPLEPSATWIAAQDDERAEVSRIVGRPTTVKLNGRSYSDCLVIDTTARGSTDHTTTVFARGVGRISTEYFQAGQLRPVRREVLSSFMAGH